MIDAPTVLNREQNKSLRRTLARLLPESAQIRPVAKDVGLADGWIDDSLTPEVLWKSVVDEADRAGRLETLLTRLLEAFPDEPTFLHIQRVLQGDPDAMTPPPPDWKLSTLPDRNPYFFGRDSIFSMIRLVLERDGAVAISHVAEVSPLGGMGKTATAVEFLYRHAQHFDYTFFLPAGSQTQLVASLRQLANRLELNIRRSSSVATLMQAITRWLEQHERWAILFDNVPGPDLIRPFWPQTTQGRVVVTSPTISFEELAATIVLPKMTHEEGQAFLLRRTRRLSTEQPERKAALDLARVVDGHPLALELSAALVSERKARFREAGISFPNRRLSRLTGAKTEQGTGLMETAIAWAAAFVELEASSPACADLLRASALLGSGSVPYELLASGGYELGEQIAAVLTAAEVTSPGEKRRPRRTSPDISEITSPGTQKVPTPASSGEITSPGLRALSDSLTTDPGDEPTVETTLPGARSSASLVSASDPVPPAVVTRTVAQREADLRQVMDTLLSPLEQLSMLVRQESERCWQVHALIQEVVRQDLREDERHLWGGRVLRALTAAYPGPGSQDRTLMERLLGLSRDALEIVEAWRVARLEAAALMQTMALHLVGLRRLDEAVPLLRSALTRRESVLDDDNPELSATRRALGSALAQASRLEEGEKLLRQALQSDEKARGEHHPDVASDLHELAKVLHLAHREDEALPLLRRALEVREKNLGWAHPDLAATFSLLGELLETQAEDEEAEGCWFNALKVREQALGGDHLEVAEVAAHLASLLDGQERFDEAEPLYRRALSITEKALGADSLELANLCATVGEHHRLAGNTQAAEEQLRRGHEILVRLHGSDSPDIAHSLTLLANFYSTQGRLDEAEATHRQVIELLEKALGSDDPEVAAALSRLALYFYSYGRFADAEPLCRRALAITEKVFGAEHPQLATDLNNLAEVLRALSRPGDAANLYRRALTITEKQLGRDHLDVAQAMGNLARMLEAQGRLIESELYSRQAASILERLLGKTHPESVACREWHLSIQRRLSPPEEPSNQGGKVRTWLNKLMGQ